MPTVLAPTVERPLLISITGAELTPYIIASLADGADPTRPVIWVDSDAEVAVRPHATRVALRPGFVIVELTLDSDQTGAQRLVVPLAIGASEADATRQTVTEHTPRGHAGLATRWGEPLQQAVWNAVLGAGNQLLAVQRQSLILSFSTVILGLYCEGPQLTFIGGTASTTAQISSYYAALRDDKTDPIEPFRLDNFKFIRENGLATRLDVRIPINQSVLFQQIPPAQQVVLNRQAPFDLRVADADILKKMP